MGLIMGPKEKKAAKIIPVKVKLAVTGDVYDVKLVKQNMKIKELRERIELASGIPYEMQKLYYLDQADLQDDTDLNHNEIVAGALLNLEVWHIWRELIEAVSSDDIEWLSRLGVCKDGDYETPNSKYMLPRKRQGWIQNRANISLYMAAHKGHANMCKKLIEYGADVNCKTSLGRTPLHVAAAQDHGKVINLLLTSNADIDIEDENFKNALQIAGEYGHKACEQHLFMFRWQQRAKTLKPEFLNPPLLAFQRCDSNFPKWKMGPHAQLYMQKIQPPEEYVGTALHAPKRDWHRKGSLPPMSPEDRLESRRVNSGSGRQKVVSFEEWQAEKIEKIRKEQLARVQAENSKREAEEEVLKQRRLRIEQRKKDKETEVYAKWQAEQNKQADTLDLLQNVGAAAGGASVEKKAPPPPPESKDEIRLRLKNVLGRYDIDPQLNAYQQWLKDQRREADILRMPYQEMIRQFCHKRCHLHSTDNQT